MPSWPVCMKFKRMLGQRNTLVFADSQVALKALQAAKHQHGYNSAKRRMISLPTRHIMGLYWVLGHGGV